MCASVVNLGWQARDYLHTVGLQAGRMRAARGHICKLSICYKNYTIIKAVRYTTYCYFFTCGPRTSLQQRVWPFAIKRLDTSAIQTF